MAGEDRAYTDWLHWQPCVAPGPSHAGGEVHHPRHDENGPVGMGLRSHDHRAVSICREHHENIEQHRGPFAGWTKEDVRRFLNEKAAALRARYLAVEASDFPR